MTYKLLISKEDFYDKLQRLSVEGSTTFYNSPFRVLYWFQKKKPFIGYIYSDKFSITYTSYLVLGFHSLEGEIHHENGEPFLSTKLEFSRLLIVFYAVLGVLFTSMWIIIFLSGGETFPFTILTILASTGIFFGSRASKKRLVRLFEDKFGGDLAPVAESVIQV